MLGDVGSDRPSVSSTRSRRSAEVETSDRAEQCLDPAVSFGDCPSSRCRYASLQAAVRIANAVGKRRLEQVTVNVVMTTNP